MADDHPHVDEALVPRKTNGKVDWLGYVRAFWPIVVGVLLVGMWLGGRIETAEQRQAHIDRSVQAAIAAHSHPTIEAPPDWFRQKVDAMDQKLDSLIDLKAAVALIEARVARIESALTQERENRGGS